MRFLFGDCELDTERYTLRRAGQVALLEPKAFRVLVHLLQRHGRAVAKVELLQACWPDTAAENYKEYALRNCLTKIRQVVGDAGTQSAVIETVHGYGYRFVADVSTPGTGVPTAATAPPRQETAPQPLPSRVSAPMPGWRQVTVLRCTLAQTPVLRRLDDEASHTLLQAFYATCESVIAPLAGYIAQYDRHALLMYFGYPVACEDAAQRAVRAGLALVEAVRRLALPGEQGRQTRLALCVGIHSGRLMVQASVSQAAPPPVLTGRTLSCRRACTRAVASASRWACRRLCSASTCCGGDVWPARSRCKCMARRRAV